MRDRFLFSADRTSSEYRGVLEITPGRARLLAPSESAHHVHRFVSIALSFAYVAVTSGTAWFLIPGLPAPPAGWIMLGIALLLWFAGYLGVLLWWDRKSLPILADGPSRCEDLVLLGAKSLGTFQEVRARNPEGKEIKLVVDTRATRFWDAVRLLQGKGKASS